MRRREQGTIVAKHVSNFRDIVGTRHIATVTVGYDLQPIILSLKDTPDYRREDSTGASFPKLQASRENEFRIHYSVGDDWFDLDLPATTDNYHFLQPLNADEWLLVRGRATSENDSNAHVFGYDGNLRRSIHAGDGIADVQVTQDSQIWISFFDEGVFSSVSTGRTGLICLDCDGRKLHDFEMAAGITGSICDCYAMNVRSKHETWLCYYTDFPLVRLTDGTVSGHWPNIPVAGSHAFAIADKSIVFIGGYNDKDRLFRVDLLNLKSHVLKPVDEDSVELPRFSAFGRSNFLFISTDEALFRIDADVII